jgi:probable F420-dependent oxidoreductase
MLNHRLCHGTPARTVGSAVLNHSGEDVREVIVKLGLFGINVGRFATDPGAASLVAQAAEHAGWDSVWAGEHFVLPDPPTPDSPAPPETPFLDPWTALTAIACNTDTLLLATGVTVVPLYEPAALAKHVASLDRISNGRFIFGIGVGYLAAEFAALGSSLRTRGAATDDSLHVIDGLWCGRSASASYLGRPIHGVRAEPPPMRTGGPPLVVGGHSPRSYRRAVQRGHGWFGYDLDPAAVRGAVDGLRRAAGEVDRPPTLGPLELSVTPPFDLEIDRRLIEEYQSLGVSRLVVHAPRRLMRDPDRIVDFVALTSALASS